MIEDIEAKFKEAIEYVRSSYVEGDRIPALLLGDVAELIKITTGREVDWNIFLQKPTQAGEVKVSSVKITVCELDELLQVAASLETGKILFSCKVDKTGMTEIEAGMQDCPDAYVVFANNKANAGLIVYAKYGDRWVPNPSTRFLIGILLEKNRNTCEKTWIDDRLTALIKEYKELEDYYSKMEGISDKEPEQRGFNARWTLCLRFWNDLESLQQSVANSNNLHGIMVPRYEAIAPSPFFANGAIFYKSTTTGAYVTNPTNSLQGDRLSAEIETMPHLFRKMNWWERRTVSELPRFVQREDYPAMIKEVISWEPDGSGFYSGEPARLISTLGYLPLYKNGDENDEN